MSYKIDSESFAITLTRADGRQIMRESIGAFPDMTPEPEPEIPEREVPGDEYM